MDHDDNNSLPQQESRNDNPYYDVEHQQAFQQHLLHQKQRQQHPSEQQYYAAAYDQQHLVTQQLLMAQLGQQAPLMQHQPQYASNFHAFAAPGQLPEDFDALPTDEGGSMGNQDDEEDDELNAVNKLAMDDENDEIEENDDQEDEEKEEYLTPNDDTNHGEDTNADDGNDNLTQSGNDVAFDGVEADTDNAVSVSQHFGGKDLAPQVPKKSLARQVGGKGLVVQRGRKGIIAPDQGGDVLSTLQDDDELETSQDDLDVGNEGQFQNQNNGVDDTNESDEDLSQEEEDISQQEEEDIEEQEEEDILSRDDEDEDKMDQEEDENDEGLGDNDPSEVSTGAMERNGPEKSILPETEPPRKTRKAVQPFSQESDDGKQEAKSRVRKRRGRGYHRLFSDSIKMIIPLGVTADLGVAIKRTRENRIGSIYEHFPDLKPQVLKDADNGDEALDEDGDEQPKEVTKPRARKRQKLKHAPQPNQFASMIDYLEAKYVQGVMVADNDDEDDEEAGGSVYSETSFLDDTGLQRTVAE